MSNTKTTAVAAAIETPETELVARLRTGDDSAFEILVRQHSPRMLAVIRRFLPSDADSSDALQDAFISVFKAIKNFHGDSSLGTWLHRIAVNSALMKIRSQKRRPERPIEDLLPKYVEDGHRRDPQAAWAVTIDNSVNNNETRELVLRAIGQLPENYRIILLLRDIEEKTTEETAQILELSVNNVKTRLHRARQALRELLDKHFGEPHP